MKISKQTLRTNFKRGLKPLQETFYNWFDSYWHKDELIDINAVKDLKTQLDNKLDSSAQDSLMDAFQDALNQASFGLKGIAIPATVPTVYDPATFPNGLYEKYDVEVAGSFTHFLKADGQPVVITADELKGLVQIAVMNGISVKIVKLLPQAKKSIINFSDIPSSDFPLQNVGTEKVQTINNVGLFQLKDGETANVGDLPGVSDVWVNLGGQDDEVRSVLDLIKVYEDDFNFDGSTSNLYVNNERMMKYPNFVNNPYSFLHTLKDYDISAYTVLHITSAMFSKEANIIDGLIGVKSDGTVDNILNINGFTGDYPTVNDFDFDISNYEKISCTFDESTIPIVGYFTTGIDYSYKSKTIEGLQKRVGDVDFYNNSKFTGGTLLNPNGTVKAVTPAWGYFTVYVKSGETVKVGLYGNPTVVIGIKYSESGNVLGNFGLFSGLNGDYHELEFVSDFDGFIRFHSSTYFGTNYYAYNFKDYLSIGERLKKSGIGQNLRDIIVNGDNPEKVKGIVGNSEECTVLRYKGVLRFYFSALDEGSDSHEHIKVGDYDPETNTVSNITSAINGTTTGKSSTTHKCSNIFIFNGVVYALVTLWFPTNGVALCKSTDGRNFTLVKNNYDNGAFAYQNGNHTFITEKINGYYYWFTEGRHTDTGNWLTKLLRTSSDDIETAVFEDLGLLKGMTPMYGGNNTHYHAGKFKMFLHGGEGNLPNWLMYAESEVSDPTYFKMVYNPLLAITRQPYANTDQIADPEVVEIDGQTYMFAEYWDNTALKCSVWRFKCGEGRLNKILDSDIY
ncbi:hypothetical protein ASG31_08480 [Chryseobacterium sp. Leaf404]|uniref:hypothetical protein n=1 Tax=unclassified Chryseobacterium TaxID=2593645 RepID=UPI0006F5F068|nr:MULTISPECIES: hypothetical protein [unclassified Chryseobacterium]KQT17437.1 hypothetical protein ASG31_08480 [Chryseobacterium sp. Leaf404]